MQKISPIATAIGTPKYSAMRGLKNALATDPSLATQRLIPRANASSLSLADVQNLNEKLVNNMKWMKL
jgi:hypothetical protein